MSIEAMKQVIELYDKHCYNNDYGGIEFNKKHGYKFIESIEALRTAIQQAEAQQPATAIACGVPGMAKTTCPYCEQGFAFEYEQPATGEPVWFHKHWCDGDDIFYRPDDNIPPGSVPLYTHPAPGVPDALEMPVENGTEYDYCSGRSAGYAEGWNDCRDAILSAQSQKE